MHHFLNLEHIFEELRKSLKPKGLLIVNEFVGPSQFQWTDKQLIIINELLEILPERLKVDVRSGRLKVPVRKPSIESMNENDPSEAIRSSDIIPLVYKMFYVEERIDFGGTILHMLLDAIIANFNLAKEEDIAILRLLGYIEDILIKEKVISSDFTLIVARDIKPKRRNSVCIYKNIKERTQRSTLELPVFSRFTLCLKENGLRYTAKRTYIYITKSLWK
jgi:SAM-dependent methyltransferase